MRTKLAIIIAATLLFASPAANAFKLSDLFGGNTGNTISNMLEGVFSKSDISVADMAGEWTVDGSAVAFQSENFLKKAGGAAATAAIKNEIDPYFEKYGLTGAIFTVTPDGNFTLRSERISLSGDIVRNKDGNFTFNFKVLGGLKIGKMTAYVQKTPMTMDVMFDATKLKSIINVAASLTGSKLASTAVKVIDSYDGICIGFGMKKTGKVEGEKESGIGSLLNSIFGGGEQQTQQTQQPQQPKNNGNSSEPEGNTSVVGTLFEMMGIGKKK